MNETINENGSESESFDTNSGLSPEKDNLAGDIAELAMKDWEAAKKIVSESGLRGNEKAIRYAGLIFSGSNHFGPDDDIDTPFGKAKELFS